MEVPITQFRREIFSLVNQALEGNEVWVTHKGRRLKIVPEGKPVSRLSRITPMEILVPGTNLEDDSWKQEMMREWERKWDRRLAPLAKPAPKASKPARVRKARLQA
jgi:antitoxin (DNA-binding transcriptional repressor) of toxin-antitoxin stability system